nr:MAG TPA: hypothetical protein [Caudoviricetes sp.]
MRYEQSFATTCTPLNTKNAENENFKLKGGKKYV